VGDGWRIQAGVVTRENNTAGDIVTRHHYKNFELVFDWKIEKGGNSGVKYRTRGNLGLEYQILDDKRHIDGKKTNHRAASLYELVAAPATKPINPAGEWNSGKIRVQGNRIEQWLNGEKVIEIEYGSEDWETRFSESKYRKHDGFGSWTGPILLQDHGNPVSFRNMRIRAL
jgi:hypothetical protein